MWHTAHGTIRLMKQRSTTPVSAPARGLATKSALVAAAVLMAISAPISLSRPAFADSYDDRIAALQQQVDQYQAQAAQLSQQANTLQQKLAELAQQQAQIQTQIDLFKAQFDQLTQQIADTEKKIKINQDALGTIISSLYVNGATTPLEMMAGSKNISEYIDKQAYSNTVSTQLNTTIKKINTLKKELETKQADAKRNLADQENAKATLATKQQEQQTLLAQTQNDEANYQNLSASAQAQKQQVQKEQQAAIEAAMRRAGSSAAGAVAGDPSRGGYPSNLANSDYYNPVVDPWGMYSRQCVSYTAWKVYQKNGYMPYWGGRGNANQWPGNARAAGIGVGTTPRAGSVGVVMAGQYGHVVWVERVNGNGTINISQYNYYNAGGSGWGNYSEMYNVSPHAYDYYIYF